MEEQRYRIEEEGTNGWFLLENYVNLTKPQATQILNQLFHQGHNPQHLRVIREK